MKPAAEFTSDVRRWQALIERDAQADGTFVYGVTTTGIYCRPVCPSRQPNRGNVRFFENWQMAEHHGFRPCRRCNPRDCTARDASIERVIRACTMIEEAEYEPSLNELAGAAGLSPYHFHRIFRKAVGVTPKQYAMELRLQRMRRKVVCKKFCKKRKTMACGVLAEQPHLRGGCHGQREVYRYAWRSERSFA